MVNSNICFDESVVIDFLYLDLNICERCKGTDLALDDALNDVASVLKASGKEVIVNKINVNSEVLAITYKFMSSPTIRVNGQDIQMVIKEDNCDSCGSLCGDKVDCRTWVYQGNEYSTPPKALIIESILKIVYANKKSDIKQEYKIPENLKNFYKKMKDKTQKKPSKLFLSRK